MRIFSENVFFSYPFNEVEGSSGTLTSDDENVVAYRARVTQRKREKKPVF